MMKQDAPLPTLRDLAAALNISAATVSRALRNHPNTALETRRQVQATARKMGYRGNPALATVMSHVRTLPRVAYRETLGWINAFDHADFFTDSRLGSPEYCHNLYAGAAERAEQLGYKLDTFWLNEPAMRKRRITDILSARGIRGLVIPPMPEPAGLRSFDWSAFATVALSYTIKRPEFHRVVPDHHHNIQLILRTLRHRGYHRIGLLIPPRFDERQANQLRSTFYFYQKNLPLPDRIPVLLCKATHTEEQGALWLKKNRPDAVITLGGFRHLRDLDIGDKAYSQNLGVVLIGYATTDRGFSSLDENPRLIAATAVDHLAGQLNRNERGIPSHSQTVLIKGTWVEGETLITRRASVLSGSF
jgi:LacI family transcriptional regulator